MSDLNMSTTITPDEAIKLLGLATKPRVTREIELSVAPDVTDKFLEAINMAIEALGKPEPHWIPVTERLPKKNGRYCVTLENGYVDNLYYNIEATKCYPKGFFYLLNDGSMRWLRTKNPVVAWREPPEPFNGVTE